MVFQFLSQIGDQCWNQILEDFFVPRVLFDYQDNVGLVLRSLDAEAVASIDRVCADFAGH